MGDVPVLHQDRITGDSESTVYQTKYNPILENSMVLRVGGATQTEGLSGDFVLDYDTGVIDLSAATSSSIEARYKGVNATDQEWIDFIGDTIDEMGDQFFRMVIRSTSGITVSAGVQTYDCPSGCIKLLEFLQSSESSGNFAKPYVNLRYDRRSNKLIMGNKPSSSSYAQITYARKVERPTETSDSIDIEDAWIQLVKNGAFAKYLRSVASKIAQQGNANTQEGMLKVNQLRANAND